MNLDPPTADKLLPAYPLAQVARFVGSNPATLRAWIHGRSYKAAGAQRRSRPTLPTASSPGEPLTFLQLVEAHVLILIRKGYGIPMKKCRATMETLEKICGSLSYLAHQDFMHDGTEIYLKINQSLVSLSERGQHVDKTIIAEGLKQLMYGEDGYADRFFPYIGGKPQTTVMLNPSIGFGQPTLARLGINTAAITARFQAGEHVQDLAADYAASAEEIEDAIRCTGELCRN